MGFRAVVRRTLRWAPALVVLALGACGEAAEPAAEQATAAGSFVDNFVLLDHSGAGHELYYYHDAPAVVIMIQGNGCPIVRNAWADLEAVREEFAARGVPFFFLNANLQDSRADIAAEAQDYGYDLPILIDDTQLIAESLGVTRTAEVLVIDPKSWSIAYRGPVNDRIGYGVQRREVEASYLRDALAALLAGEAVGTPSRPVKGCIVNLKEAKNRAAHAEISYSRTIAPMLIENCVACHQPGGIGPWAMTDYAMIEGFAPMIREVVRTKRMPPWSADPHFGAFENARGLTVEERRTLVHWIEAGAPRGTGPDPLALHVAAAAEWPLGEPDLVIETPPFEVPASGVVDYQFPTVPNPLTEDVWVRAVTVLPGDAAVVHHALIGSSQRITPPGEAEEDDVFENYLAGYVPGAESFVYPEGTGVEVKAGGEYRFQMHYTPSGRPTTDRTRLGLYFHDGPPAYRLRQQVVLNPWIRIPAGAPAHTERAYFEFDRPATVYALFPHAHYRGKASKFALHYPDGRVETALSVPRYDFNWQHSYWLATPLTIPAGTRLVHETVYDNSPRNFANPDPTRTVPWGLQSHDEMLYGSVMFRWTEETRENPVHDALQFDIRQFYGFADADMDGRLVRAEMHGRLAESWDKGELKDADRDEDGALSFDEFYAFRKAQRERRQDAASRQ